MSFPATRQLNMSLFLDFSDMFCRYVVSRDTFFWEPIFGNLRLRNPKWQIVANQRAFQYHKEGESVIIRTPIPALHSHLPQPCRFDFVFPA